MIEKTYQGSELKSNSELVAIAAVTTLFITNITRGEISESSRELYDLYKESITEGLCYLKEYTSKAFRSLPAEIDKTFRKEFLTREGIAEKVKIGALTAACYMALL